MLSNSQFDQIIQLKFPLLPWGEPIMICPLLDRDDEHYACRLCICRTGFKASQISSLPTDPEAIRKHIRESHVISK